MAPAIHEQARICVFGSAQSGTLPADVDCARSVARIMHEKNMQLVYGGGGTGLVGEISRMRVKLGGTKSVIGVTPIAVMKSERGDELDWEQRLQKFFRKTRKSSKGAGSSGKAKSAVQSSSAVQLPTNPTHGTLVGVESLSARKAHMIRLVKEGGPGSGFLVLSGGFGTLDELAEVITLRHRGVHSKPIVLLNVEGYWDGFVDWAEAAVGRGLVRDNWSTQVKVAESPREAIRMLK